MHDFRAKLSDPRVAPALQGYLRYARARRAGRDGQPEPFAPVSVNLDLTMACDYRCVHCIDAALINGGGKLAYPEMEDMLRVLAAHGLRSVILIGGGEPTLHPDFERVVRLVKLLGIQCAIASNGAHNDRIAAVAGCLERGDWVRLSLDAGTDATFQALHRPRRGMTLEHICQTAVLIKQRNAAVQLGFSYVVMWTGGGNSAIATSNVEEMATAAQLAKACGFDYISFKPMLVRNAERAEVVDSVSSPVVERIREHLRRAREFEDARFHVVPSRNLAAMLEGVGAGQCRLQPRECHMQHFRQVLAPGGVYACPAHRGNRHSLIGDRTFYSNAEKFATAFQVTAEQVRRFDAAMECREITCIYNETNWWIEGLIESGSAPAPAGAPDFFL